LRKELLSRELEMVDGMIALPTAPGLGVEVDRDALERFAEAARSLNTRNARG
jgi:D-galactarolactone cycloisomerase